MNNLNHRAPGPRSVIALAPLALLGFLGAGTLTGHWLAGLGPAEAQQPLTTETSPEASTLQPMRAPDGIDARVADFLAYMNGNEQALVTIDRDWGPGSLPMAIELLRIAGSSLPNPQGLVEIIEARAGIIPRDLDDLWRHAWSQPYDPPRGYAHFKAALYRVIDPRFAEYFNGNPASRIRLDEIRWGGVVQDGIPPLRNPRMLKAPEATGLEDDNVVFGIEINGDARAYPKRILAWHEMFTDTVGGVEVAGVYCTLCGTVILYETNLNGVRHRLGTSGFLYRSNKLMYDADTHSLWNTLRGTPVVGPLAEADPPIELARRPVVTTTWGEWKRRHPGTTVLSFDTGHRRDYGDGVAYRDYFATDELMFIVPEVDARLKNKQEVLGLTFPEAGDDTLAIDADFLFSRPVYHDRLGPVPFVVLTDATGANRVYAASDIRFTAYDRDLAATDEAGVTWTLSERALTAPDGRSIPRLPAQRAFWFGWNSAFERTRLVTEPDPAPAEVSGVSPVPAPAP